MRKKGSKNKEYSAEFKIGVIMDMREHHLGYRETGIRQGTVLCLVICKTGDGSVS